MLYIKHSVGDNNPFEPRHEKNSKLAVRHLVIHVFRASGLLPAILGKGSWPKLGKNYRLNSKIGRN